MPMPDRHLWYVRRGEVWKGPFPIAVIERNIGLGRIVADDQLSTDAAHWRPAHLFPDFDLLCPKAGRPVPARLDERQRERRRALAAAPESSDPARRQRERRRAESPEVVGRRGRSDAFWLSARRVRPSSRGVSLTIATLLLGLGAGSWFLHGSPGPEARDCAAPPQPGRVWDFCDKQGADLRSAQLARASLRNASLAGADLRDADLRGAALAYANLTRADLVGADLSGADLKGATLSGADLGRARLRNVNLRFADLSGAELSASELTGADFGNAIWSSGEVCAAVSIGACVLGIDTVTRAVR
jgi:hypothetical protein